MRSKAQATGKAGAAAKKADQAEMARRLGRTAQMITQCHPSHVIAATLAREFDVSERQVWKYMREVLLGWQERAKEEAPFRREELRAQLREFYQAARAEGEYAPAAKALDLLGKLEGAYAPVKVMAAVEVNEPTAMTTAERQARIRQLLGSAGVDLADAEKPTKRSGARAKG